ncbi:MAG: hypothetical protein HUU37_07110 [Bdellovibrionales bacterium]|nr:hypothetical protein [Bdellovibrionales bacterium]
MSFVERLKADFVDIHLLLEEGLGILLEKLPHELEDTFGNRISSAHEDEVSGDWIALNPWGTGELLRCRTSAALAKSLPTAISEGLKQAAGRLEAKLLAERELLIGRDVAAVTDPALAHLPIAERIPPLLRRLQAHLPVESASVFGLPDGFTLEGVAGIEKTSGEKIVGANWRTDLLAAAGVAASTRKAYWSENPSADPNVPAKGTPPRNLVCYPLLHGEHLVGVLNLVNRVDGGFSAGDEKIIAPFSRAAALLMRNYYLAQQLQLSARTSDHLGKYLSKKVARSVKGVTELELGGVEKKVVVLFADIRSFTSITEGIDASTLVNLLNFFYEKMTAVIEKHEGTVDKIVGDMLMAVWNIPHDQPNPELLAMKAALDMQKEMARSVQAEWNRHGVTKVTIGIGVNAGPAVAGNLGSSRFMNYTVVGDTINTAQRIQSKAGGGEVWMAESLFPLVQGQVERPIRKEVDIKMKGKEQTVNAYVYKPLDYSRY